MVDVVMAVQNVDAGEAIRWVRQLLDGKILDGKNRYIACKRAGLNPYVEHLPEDTNPYDYVWSMNGLRRHLDEDQRYLIKRRLLENGGRAHPAAPPPPATDG